MRKSFCVAAKKSIIDYILLDPVEQARLSVYIRHNPVMMYGTARNSYQRKPENSFVKNHALVFKDSLLKRSKHTVKIQSMWVK